MDASAQNQPLIHSFDTNKKQNHHSNIFIIGILFLAILVGAGTGFALSKTVKTSKILLPKLIGKNTQQKTSTSAGIADKSTFKDQTEGLLREGGIEGEGAFHLERPGGPTQNVYLTSTTLDLSPFVDKKIKVWGKTFQGEKAGWLMDVGYVEVIE